VIAPGSSWGEAGVPPRSLVVARNEGDLGQMWQAGIREATLRDGSLRRVAGTHGGPPRVRVLVDVIVVSRWIGASRSKTILLGTMVLRSGRFPWSAVGIVTNSGFWGHRRIVTRAHPNDGYLDVLQVDPDMPIRQRIAAWKRASRGDHLPHPSLHVVHETSWTSKDGWYQISSSGCRSSWASRVACEIVPDAMTVWL